jgi:hypothetical protein
MLHTTMIVLHAAAGVAAFVAGCLALFPPGDNQRASQVFQVYLVSLGLMMCSWSGRWRPIGSSSVPLSR